MGLAISIETLTKATSDTVLEKAVGGSYQLPDGREFWIDHVAAQEITRRVQDAIAAEVNKQIQGG